MSCVDGIAICRGGSQHEGEGGEGAEMGVEGEDVKGRRMRK